MSAMMSVSDVTSSIESLDVAKILKMAATKCTTGTSSSTILMLRQVVLDTCCAAPGPMLNSLRTIFQKWSKPQAASSSSAAASTAPKGDLAMFGIILTECICGSVASGSVGGTNCANSHIDDNELVCKYIKVISFSIGNAMKFYQELPNDDGNIIALLGMFESTTRLISSRLLALHRENKKLFQSGENSCGNFITFHLQSVSQLILKYRAESSNFQPPSLEIKSLVILSSVISATCNGDVLQIITDIVRQSVVDTQLSITFSNICDALWILANKIDALSSINPNRDDKNVVAALREQAINVIRLLIGPFSANSNVKFTGVARVFESSTVHYSNCVKASDSNNTAKGADAIMTYASKTLQTVWDSIRGSRNEIYLDYNDLKRVLLFLWECSSQSSIAKVSHASSGSMVALTKKMHSGWENLSAICWYTLDNEKYLEQLSLDNRTNMYLLCIAAIAESIVFQHRMNSRSTSDYSVTNAAVASIEKKLLVAFGDLNIVNFDCDNTVAVEIATRLHFTALQLNTSSSSSSSTAKCEMSSINIVKSVCSSLIRAISKKVEEKKTVNFVMISNAIARAVTASLGHLQKVLSDEKSVISSPTGGALVSRNGIIALDLIAAYLEILSQQTLFNSQSNNVVPCLRAIGNTMNHINSSLFTNQYCSVLCNNLETFIGSYSSKIDKSNTGRGELDSIILLLSSLLANRCQANDANETPLMLIKAAFTFIGIRTSTGDKEIQILRRMFQMVSALLCKSCSSHVGSNISSEDIVDLCRSILSSSDDHMTTLMPILINEVISRINDFSDDECIIRCVSSIITPPHQIVKGLTSHNSVMSEKEIKCLELYVKSHFQWICQSGDSASVVVALRSLGDDFDPSGVAIVSRGAAAKKRAPKVVVPPPLAEVATVSTHLFGVRLWLLLAQWAFPAVLIHAAPSGTDDVYISDGTHGAAVYLTNAMKMLKAACTAGGAVNSRVWVSFLASDCEVLFHLLGLHGRIDDQVKLTTYCLAILSSPAICDNKNCCCYRELSVAIENMCVLLELQNCFNGRPRLTSGVAIPARGDVKVSSAAPDLYAAVYTFVDECQAITARHAKQLTNAESIESLAETAMLSLQQTNKIKASLSSLSNGSAHNVAMVVRSWICLLSSRVLLCKFALHAAAYSWAKKCIGLLAAPKDSSSGSSNSYTVDVTLARLESAILVAELYEQTGDVDRTLSYAAEAVAVAKVGSSALANVVSLHCVRIWYRMKSARFLCALTDLLALTNDSIDDAYDTVSKNIRCTASCISAICAVDDAGSHSRAGTKSSNSFRFVDCLWGIDNSEPGQHSAMMGEHKTCLHSAVRAQLAHVFATEGIDGSAVYSIAGTVADRTCDIDSKPFSLLSCSGAHSFDVIRDYRRRCCLDLLVNRKGSAAAHAFILGAASCLVSHECSLSREREPLALDLAGDTAAIALVQRACAGDGTAIDCVDGQLKMLTRSALSAAAHGSKGGCGAVCFASIERSTGRLLLGRFDDTCGYEVASLPIADRLRGILREWESVMTSVQDTLVRTANCDRSKVWGEEEKRLWWSARRASDEKIRSILLDLQSALGKYISIFTGIGEGDNVGDSVDALTGSLSQLDFAPRPAAQAAGTDALNKELGALKVADLRSYLKSRLLSTKGTKQEMVDRALEEAAKAKVRSPVAIRRPTPTTSSGGGHVVIVLDESLQGLPFECMPLLELRKVMRTQCTISTVPNIFAPSPHPRHITSTQVYCSRVPGLSVLLSMAGRLLPAKENNLPAVARKTLATATAAASRLRAEGPGVRVSKAWFAVDVGELYSYHLQSIHTYAQPMLTMRFQRTTFPAPARQ